MSLVGTRPILQDELQKYELHHRARIAIKPGITGMWQVSGRSDITDFEEVVRLDTEYISKSTNKFRYQANRAFIIGRIKSIIPKILCGLFELSIIEQLYTDAVRCRSQLLPGRSFPRKKLKSKGRSHFRNKKVSF